MKYKIAIATPTFGKHVSLDYHLTMMSLAKSPEIIHIDARLFAFQDLVRARSRMVRMALEHECTHLFFVDADVSFEPALLNRMLATKHDVIAVAYPLKKIDWEGVEKAVKAGQHPETGAYAFPIKPLPGAIPNEDLTVEVQRCGTGCMLISRECLVKMTDAFKDGLTFTDVVDGKGTPTVAVFAQKFARERGPDGEWYTILLGEDYSFCERWRSIGGKIMLYIGPEAPANHHGDMKYGWPRDERPERESPQ